MEISIADQGVVLQKIIDQIVDGVIVGNSKGEFLMWNKAGQEIIGLGPLSVPVEEWSNVYGCFCEDGTTLCPPQDLLLAKAIRGEKVINQIICIRNAMVKERWLSLSGEPLIFENGTAGGVIVFRDITSIVRMNLVVQQLQDLVKVQKEIG